jgi:hypothetical protein
LAYWTDIFTLETWAQADRTQFSVSGFPPPTPTKGGYSIKLFERISKGDVLLCYCKTPAKRWVGALRVTSDAFQDHEPVWGLTESGDVRYPWRFRTEPLLALDPTVGVPGAEAAAKLGFLSRLGPRWGVYLQRSLNPIPDADGETLLSLLHEERDAVPIPHPSTRRRRPPVAEQPEPTHLEAQAVLPVLTVVDSGEPTPPTESRTHTEIQGKLRDIGFYEGYDVWVADRGVVWEGTALGEGCLADLPVVANESTRRTMRNIDVIWFRKGTGHPVRFFEIEHSTTVYSGLLRFNDVMIDFPVPQAFVVGDGDKTQRKFEREIARRTFDHSGLASVASFLQYDQVRETWQRYRTVGSGSRAWGRAAAPSTRRTEKPA